MSFLARTETNANGATTTFPVSFPLPPQQGRAGVNVYVHSTTDAHPGVPKVAGVDFNWVSDGQIAFVVAPANGTVVDIRRATLDTALDNTIQAGGSLRSAELVQNDTQLLYITQELQDEDADLQAQIDVEAAAVNAEAATRAAADTAETNARVAAVSAEAGTRAAADTAEASTRATADTGLSSRISAVEGRTGQVIVNGTPYDMSAYPLPVLTPEQFGAQHTALVDDGPALHSMSVALNILGGGTIWMDPGQTYWVGSQTHNGALPQGGTYTWAPTTSYPIEVSGTTKGVVIMGNGATIKCLAGKKYGTFDDAGVAMATGTGYFGTGISTPYQAMVYIHGCSGSVRVSDLELDGNISNAAIGGLWGDTGRQLPMSGVSLQDNTGLLDISVYSHHHGLDGGIGNGPGLLLTREPVTIRGRYINNGRNNFSHVGGNGWTFEGASFIGAGKNIGAMAYSAPGAGIDLEAEGGKYVVNTVFRRVVSIDNHGVAIIRDSSVNTYRTDCYNCLFIGTTSYSLWTDGPGWRFYDCTILGTFIHGAAADPEDAAKFYGCRFLNRPDLSPTGTLYAVGSATFYDPGGGSTNMVYDDCLFETNLGPGSGGAIMYGGWFHNCRFRSLAGGAFLAINGTFSGPLTNFINGGLIPRADLAITFATNYAGPSWDSFLYNGTRYEGDTDRSSGKKLYYKTVAYDPPSLALGAADAIQTTTVTGASLGDLVQATFDQGLAGMDLRAWVSAADTVRFYFINENGANPLNLAAGNVKIRVRAQ